MLKIYDSLVKSEVLFDIPVEKTINLYSCGPTVYGPAHIGNLRSYIMADMIFRALKANGYKVNWVMNLTDIDDKTINGTIAEFGNSSTTSDLRTYTQKFSERFFDDLRAVGINTEQIKFINVTDVIPEIEDFINQLLKLDFAYKAEDGSTYFSIEKYQQKFGDYGSLVGAKFLEGKKIGARIKNDEYDKENLSDFALWKAWDQADGQIFWDSPSLGKGRPGWHIECSVINKIAFQNEATDIHTGGVDLIFPHHTNEIAQSQPLGPFVKHWVHFEHLLVDGKKMAKSLKNFYTLEDLATKGFSGLDLRYLFLQSGFRQQSNFTWDALSAARSAHQKLQSHFSLKKDAKPDTELLQALNNDLNTAQVLSIAHTNPEKLATVNEVLGLGLQENTEIEVPENIKELLNQRQTARDQKDFAKSDQLRDQIAELGFEVLDTPDGQKIVKK